MRTLARYIASRFIMTITGTFLLCLVLIFMIDFVEMLRQSGKFGSVPARRLIWITLLRLPAYAEITLPFAVLVGTIAAFLLLSRKSELSVARASGMSVWQFLFPGLLVGTIMGVLSVVAYNPMAAAARAQSEREFADAFGRHEQLLRSAGDGAWLRQDGADGPSVINAAATSEGGLSLAGVQVFQFDRSDRFIERIDAEKAQLRDGYWELQNAWVVRVAREPERYDRYVVSTYLSPERVQDALGSVIALSFWELPDFIDLAEKAGIPATRYKVAYDLLLSRPALLIAMVLLGATVSLRSFRQGGVQTMIVLGMVAGFGFFLLAEVCRQVGVAGLTPPAMAAWVPPIVSSLMSLTVLLHQEDG